MTTDLEPEAVSPESLTEALRRSRRRSGLDRRRAMERPLLDLYHAELKARGVSDYDRRALDDDYRLSALWCITTPVWQSGANIPPVIWWNNFERIHMAVEELGCRDLLERPDP
jgi:hypothetical protein